MPVIDVDKARAWAKERWPSPVVRRQVDFLLAHCPRTKEITAICCKDCKHALPLPVEYNQAWANALMVCGKNGWSERGHYVTVWADSTCDDAEEREE